MGRVIGAYTDKKKRVRPITERKSSRGYNQKPKRYVEHQSKYGRRSYRVNNVDRMYRQWQGPGYRPGLEESEHAGDTDMSFSHSKRRENRVDAKIGRYDPDSDVTGLDHPKSTMLSYVGPTDRKIYVGGGNATNRKHLRDESRRIVNNSFTREEVLEMGPLYFQVGGQGRGSAGSCRHLASIKHKRHISREVDTPHIIFVKTDMIGDPDIITHELVHARRWGQGQYSRDRDNEEKKTELESMSRMSNRDFNNRGASGYYQHIPEVKKAFREDYTEGLKLLIRYQKEDRKTVTDGKRMIGKPLVKRVNDRYPKTHISRAHFSPAEKLDRYFIVKTKSGDTFREHNHYEKPIADKTVKTDMKKRYPGSQAWEFQDGKKVRYY